MKSKIKEEEELLSNENNDEINTRKSRSRSKKDAHEEHLPKESKNRKFKYFFKN